MAGLHQFPISAIVILLLLLATEISGCSSWQDCGDFGCSLPDYDNDFIASLMRNGAGFSEFGASLKKAVSILRKYPGVISDDADVRHMTVQYLCCYNVDDFARIVDIVRHIAWTPFNLTFAEVVCNLDHPGHNDSTVSFIVLADAASQLRMAAFVAGVEQTIVSHGIPIHRPRSAQEPFHSTIGRVRADYPVAQVLAELQQAFGVFNTQPMIVDSFSSAFPSYEFHASGDV
eukprot:TRINITY_DN29196_c0_g1_i1.p1 TRINITY_DN29196_c0_g1~~TRINITY_DN29196_c0_g1_i1.p1  ORF type:complete len:231 (-),score=40.25 TRINITY_DN29196_c0_g1_i1:54-746(-)